MKSPKLSSPRANARSPRPRRQFDRHSAEGNLRSPKRNGAGGNYVWGTIMDQEGPIYVDQNDPNYDSDLDGNGFVLQELNLTQLKKEMQHNDDHHDQKNESVGGMATSPPMTKGPGSDSGDSSASSTGKKNQGEARGEKKG